MRRSRENVHSDAICAIMTLMTQNIDISQFEKRYKNVFVFPQAWSRSQSNDSIQYDPFGG